MTPEQQLVASTALAGFGGLFIIELAKLFKTKKPNPWLALPGFGTLAFGISFASCIIGALTWFEDQRLYPNIQFTSGLDQAHFWFNIQLFAFLFLFLIYVLGTFFPDQFNPQ
jgi:hypothetical protein